MTFSIPLLSTFVQGGSIPEGNLIVVGPSGIGKTIFCETIINGLLLTKARIMYVTLDHSPNEIRTRIEAKGIPVLEDNTPLMFVDGYSWLVGEMSEKYSARNLSNLSDLSVKMISASNELGIGIFFIFDSVSSLLVYNAETEVERFLGVNMARMKHAHNLGLWVVEEGIHSESFYNVLRHKSDGVLEMKFEDSDRGTVERYIRLHTLKNLKHEIMWKPFEIQDGQLITQGREREKDLYLTAYMKNS
jgi:KaiC/GvpD/RAD55 family RecA-like ATPase